MKKEIRTIIYDEELRLEAYRFEGIVQPFPNHFHEHYVIGLMEKGGRLLSCKNKEYTLTKGDIVLFNPKDNHSCCHTGDEALDYRAFNISTETMQNLTEEITGTDSLPSFTQNVIENTEAACYFQNLHKMVMEDSDTLGKEENLLLLISQLLQNYSQPFENCLPSYREEVEKACRYMERHFAESIHLNDICTFIALSKSTLLRAFTRTKGLTPYRYLQAIRINESKKRLEQGFTPLEAAMQTGFSDQSHFTNYFRQCTGLSPGTYREIFSNKNITGGISHEK